MVPSRQPDGSAGLASAMLTADLVRLYPKLFHMAEEDSWSSIQRHGLLTAEGMVSVGGSATRSARR